MSELGATPASIERRERLLRYLRDPRRQALADHGMASTAKEIVRWTSPFGRQDPRHSLYEGPYGNDRCFDDLKALEKQGLVERLPGRPARWKAR